jgi:3-oxoacyl-[acyl-carrier protein] reductase
MTEQSTSLIVVVGGGTGMGRDIALDQSALGHDVLIAGRREEALLETRQAADDPSRLIPVVADASTTAGAEAIRAATDGRPIAGIVIAAGGQGSFIEPGTELAEIESAWGEALQKNLLTAVLPIEALLPQLTEERGRIVLISSASALDGRGGPYATAKAALTGYGRDLAVRAGERGITANSIAPGFVAETGFFAAGGLGDSAPMIETAAARTLVGRVGTPTDITAAARWLLSADAGWVTGQVIAVDGGTVMVQ